MTPALGKLKQEGHTFEASLGYRVGPYQKTKNKKNPKFLIRPLNYTPVRNACLILDSSLKKPGCGGSCLDPTIQKTEG